MDINWALIKETIRRDLGAIFQNGNPRIDDVDEGIELFKKILYSNICSSHLGGLAKTLSQALHDAYIEKIGDGNSLRIIADSIEPYFKKLCIIAEHDKPEAILGKTLMPLLKLSKINSALSNQGQGSFPVLEESKTMGYRGMSEYLEFICDSYVARNKVHSSPELSRVEVLTKLNSLMVVYIYSAVKYKNEIIKRVNSEPSDILIQEKIGSDQLYLYHFITFGEKTNKIRNQIVVSYILNYLHQVGTCRLEKLKSEVNGYFSSDMSEGYYQNVLLKLEREKKVSIDRQLGVISLSSDERGRINLTRSNFEDNRKIFFLYLQDIAVRYNVDSYLGEILDRLKEFIENNYRLDEAESYCRGEMVEKDQNNVFLGFIQYLQSITSDRDFATNLFKDLIQLSRDSDFLLRMCASKAFATLTNPDRFEQYIQQQDLVVYLDTQIVLHVLCDGYVDDPEYENYFFSIATEVISLAQKSRQIRLKVSRYYLQEVIYHLRLALLLVPFEEFCAGKISTNVFYSFYWNLREKQLLNEDDFSFGDFMKSWFQLEERDVYAGDFGRIAMENLVRYLEDLGIEVVALPTSDNFEDAKEIIYQVIESEKVGVRPRNVVSNDAGMLCYLCDSDVHVLEPFFLTWDKAFTSFRREYLKKYKRSELISFHLFSPGRFLNHYSLMKLKINPQAISDDYLSLLESLDIRNNTQTIWDTVNKFLNIEGIDATRRRRYLAKVRHLVEEELNYRVEDYRDFEKTQRVVIPFEEVLSRINEFYSGSSKYSLRDYKVLLSDEDNFSRVSELVIQTVVEERIDDGILLEIDKLIGVMKKEINENRSESDQ